MIATQGEKALALLREPGVLTDELRRKLIELLLTPPQERRMSYEEFLEWADEDTLAEWVDGRIVPYSPASKRHQELADFLLVLMRLFVEHRDLGVVLSAPFQMKLPRSGREPDLIFIAKAHLDRLKATYLDGPADLAVEIVSPESVGRDRGEKFYEYEEAGIPEYWLIDPLTQRAEFYRRDDQGRYRLVSPDAEGVYRSAVLPGFWLNVAWLWQPPPVIEALVALGIVGPTAD
ncbi:MAG: Uma2 family endonuclease [Chloroflexi bacterium]|nr:MAG: Uma2 family endonuclease [Chloroflexota bacterium]